MSVKVGVRDGRRKRGEGVEGKNRESVYEGTKAASEAIERRLFFSQRH